MPKLIYEAVLSNQEVRIKFDDEGATVYEYATRHPFTKRRRVTIEIETVPDDDVNFNEDIAASIKD